MSELIKCSKCDGKGILVKEDLPVNAFYYCAKCKGVGVLTWIENIFDKQYPLTNDEHTSRVRNLDCYYGERKEK